MFNCPCGKQTQQLMICGKAKHGRMTCKACEPCEQGSAFNPNLNQTYVRDGNTRVTTGKAWEIRNRVVSRDDGKTVINKVTGKPTQY